MKYEKEINELLYEMVYQDWMDDSEVDYLRNKILEESNVTKEELSRQIDEGVKNGYSVEFQLGLIKKVWNSLKRS